MDRLAVRAAQLVRARGGTSRRAQRPRGRRAGTRSPSTPRRCPRGRARPAPRRRPAACRPARGSPIPAAKYAREAVGQLVAPRPEPVVAAARRGLPLGLGRQPHARPGAEGERFVAAHVGDRSLVLAVARCELPVLRVRHRRAREAERLDIDDAARRLVLVGRICAGRVAAHQERPGRDRAPFERRRHVATPGSPAARPATERRVDKHRLLGGHLCVCRPIGSPVFGFRSRRGKFDDETSIRIRWPRRTRCTSAAGGSSPRTACPAPSAPRGRSPRGSGSG